ncbi:hypothetical protein BJ138DRAFT_1156856 [Hygrophoropsis aurantiaca]|uniref:Uncharacterized protein n=1 Tax=Hygrophoropsis aurantiaca TaxID=72124 RepID=A0ACB8A734_9AGAM|nr:hypothetical protein BJ138DRAFT_1156856 [Hygrophoropsis aurantiaca]
MISFSRGILSLLVIYLSRCQYHAVAAARILDRTESTLIESLAVNCQFTFAGFSFDLCPLIQEPAIHVEVTGSGSAPKRVYEIDLKEYAEEDRSSATHCPLGTWICMTESSAAHSGSKSIAGKNVSGESYPSLDARRRVVLQHQTRARDSSSLSVRFLSGSSTGAVIEFACAPKSSGKLDFRGVSDHGVHSFFWSTKYACARDVGVPLGTVATSFDEDKTDEKDSGMETDPHHNDTDPDEKELMQIPESGNHSIPTIVAVTGVGVLVIAMLAYYPPKSLRSAVRKYTKSGRFRVGEINLVHWANEDMGFLDEEVGTMVNADNNDDLDGDDESIPLKPSPRQKSVRYYGSAQ